MKPVYDDLARYYDAFFRPLEKWFLAAARQETLSLLGSNERILEIGAGTGANFKYYPPVKQASAIELSGPMIQRAIDRKGPITLVRADAQHLPFDTDRFDAAFATLVFCSVPDPELAFAELKRVVRPGGRIVLLEHVRPDGFLGPVFDLISKITVALIDDHFDRRTAELAQKSGLHIIEVRRKLRGIVNLIVCEVVS